MISKKFQKLATLTSLLTLASTTVCAGPYFGEALTGIMLLEYSKQYDKHTVFDGPYVLKEGSYNFDSEIVRKFGATDVESPFGVASIRDSQYGLNKPSKDSKLSFQSAGTRLFPVVESATDFSHPYDGDEDRGSLEAHPNYPDAFTPNFTINGKVIKGSEEVDKFLWDFYGYDKEKAYSADFDFNEFPLTALISYGHPEQNKVKVGDVGKGYKMQGTFGHLGLYLGKGVSRNSPYGLHNNQWWGGESDHSMGQNERQTVNVTTVGLKGVPAKTFNKNFYVTTRLLNELQGGVEFPSNYKFDYFHAASLKDAVSHFRGWIDKSYVRFDVFPKNYDHSRGYKTYFELLKNSNIYHQYCAEHITNALNVAANLPQNEKGYIAMFGAEDYYVKAPVGDSYEMIKVLGGKSLFKRVKKLWAEQIKRPFPIVEDFEPLWMRGNSFPRKSYTKSLVGRDSEGKGSYLYHYQKDEDGNYKPAAIKYSSAIERSKVGKSMVWSPVTTAELLANISETYANFKVTSSIVAANFFLGTIKTFSERTGFSQNLIASKVPAVVAPMVVLDAVSSQFLEVVADRSVLSSYTKEDFEKLARKSVETFVNGAFAQGFDKAPEAIQLATKKLALEWLDKKTGASKKFINELGRLAKSYFEKGAEHAKHSAYMRYRQVVRDSFKDVKGLRGKITFQENVHYVVENESEMGQKVVNYYSNPAIVHRAETGLHPYHKDVWMKTVGTVVNAGSVSYAEGVAQTFADAEGNVSQIMKTDPKAPVAYKASDLVGDEMSFEFKEESLSKATELENTQAEANSQNDQAPVNSVAPIDTQTQEPNDTGVLFEEPVINDRQVQIDERRREREQRVQTIIQNSKRAQ